MPEGLNTVTANLNAALAGMQRGSYEGLLKGALKVQRDAQALTPVDTGFLRNSATTQGNGRDLVVVGFRADYS